MFEKNGLTWQTMEFQVEGLTYKDHENIGAASYVAMHFKTRRIGMVKMLADIKKDIEAKIKEDGFPAEWVTDFEGPYKSWAFWDVYDSNGGIIATTLDDDGSWRILRENLEEIINNKG